MEDFEYSVEISDRDWEYFFMECEECNLLPPSLAGVDDSGMSDIDDTGSILAKRAQKVNPTADFSESERLIDGPPDCEGSPVEHYLSKHGVGGMESVLSGSEEDIHLQSVNIFFERLKNVTEAEMLTEPSQVRAGKNREVIQEEKCCSDGQQASSTALPKNIPKVNALPARGETAVGKETTESVDTISNLMKTIKKDEPGSNMSPEPAASNPVLKANKSAHPETKLLIIEETCTEATVNDATQRQSQSHDSPDGVETTPHTDGVIKVKMHTPQDCVKREDMLRSTQLNLSKECSPDSWSNLEMLTNVKWKEDLNVSQSDATCTNKTGSQESSPSASVKRKRRKKRRLSVEQAESVRDSEEEQNVWRGGSEDVNVFHLNEPRQNVMSSLIAYSATSSFPVNVSAKEMKENDLSHYSCQFDSHCEYSPERVFRPGKREGSTASNAINNRSLTQLSRTDDSLMPAFNSSGNVATHFRLCSNLQVEKSTGLNKQPSITESATAKTGRDRETANYGRNDTNYKMNHSVFCCENEQSCTAEVKSLTHSILQSTKSNDPIVEVGQSDKLSAAKSVLAEEAGNSGRDTHAMYQRDTEPQQQLEIDCHYKDKYSSTLENAHFRPSADASTPNTKAKQFETSATSHPLPVKYCLSNSPSKLDIDVTGEQTEHPLVLHTVTALDVLSEKNKTAERAQLEAYQNGNPFLSGEINPIGKSCSETKSSVSEDFLTSPSDITPISSCCTLDTESLMSLSNNNITDMSGGSYSSISQNDCELQRDKTSLILAKLKEGDDISGLKSQSESDNATDSKCYLALKAEDSITVSQAEPENAPDSKQSVFAMSSFWNEMEKLTINDILGLRMISRATPPGSLPPLQEREETDTLTMTDSGFLDEPKPPHTTEDMSCYPNSTESSSVYSRGVAWESKPVSMSLGADIYTENMMLKSLGNISQPVLPGTTQTCLRRICKNVSMHNLEALETLSYTCKSQTLQTSDDGELEKVEYITDGHVPKQDNDADCLASSVKNSYRISLTDIFQYLFGGNKSNPEQSATDNVTTCYTEGNSVPETYDHFFSEFDTESLFYPLITADQAKDELVPVFSYSRSASRNLQYPEAYDHFFASSSSDDSSVESDEEDICGPVRVVSRFSHSSSASKISTDVYDNFFTDGDLSQNFFWRNAFSFRNISSTGSTSQRQTPPNSLVPVRQSGRILRKTGHAVNVLGNQDVVFPDHLLYHLEERISIQLAQQPFRYEDLQTAVSNPRLDASFLPLRQSDMCLVCIAFASWVLKTANPQVGDAWKAVLLANVSALSAIRYLRKYVKIEAAASERKLYLTAPSES
ncbi:PGC-1 and ERR-induced regulator in muscle protein 1 isoform X1 [Acanthopagrus latus]|nr:PGC-1 and ERR-induced regulator in muscle protein 1 isoform X1 [Acanthopagrus latus]XP_036960755.1 PGC-1 and ERR-induced regulator in muscle protein 1 isoform X1 [Acanthopagrus latus]XP_036960756.1 PGC-1 and ERR-induced regulator in muscle protein 1 isoform X1 [Acanthopagrus latus]